MQNLKSNLNIINKHKKEIDKNIKEYELKKCAQTQSKVKYLTGGGLMVVDRTE